MSSAGPELWPRVEAALEAALAAPKADREDVLERLCAGDSVLRREVQSLLDAHDASEGFLAGSAHTFAAPYMDAVGGVHPLDRPGALVGRYRLVEEIGRGGMGTVWLAERADGQFEQRVAVKLLKRGMDTDEILDRFLRERQILARLEHPQIARLLDGGATDDGRPYLVMEYVAGTPITTHCDAQGLSIEDRLRLFALVCRAVGYAHRNLVVHRDIKPSNVLIDASGGIKLLDFGIAKVLDDEGRTLPTVARFLTPEYASPEQRAGEPVTTASDVYQLGALLYELLTGARPWSPDSSAGDGPRRPSTATRRARAGSRGEAHLDPATIAGRRRTTPKALRRCLRGDLDTIAMRALRAEPEQRYAGAEALAEDVERHLVHLPIRADGERLARRTRKFVRRHRVPVAVAVTGLAIVVSLVAVDMVRVRTERDRARHEADKAMETAQLMSRFLQGWSPDASDRGVVDAEKMLRDAAARAERELRARPEMLAATLSALGDFQTTLGEWGAADTLLSRAQGIQEELSDEPSLDLATTLARRGRLARTRGDHAAADAWLRQSLALHRSLLGPSHIETLRVLREIAVLRRLEERWEESERLAREVLGAMPPEDRAVFPFALETATELGYALFQQARFDEAIAILEPTLERQRAIFGEIHASTLFTIRALGSSRRDRGDLEEAEDLYREALRIAQALYGEEHEETEAAIFVLALVLQREEELEEAEASARQSLALSERIHGPGHFVEWGRRGLVGAILLDGGDDVGAEREIRRVLEGVLASGREAEGDSGDLLNRLAYVLVKRDADDAGVFYRRAVAFDEARPPGSPIFVTDGIHFLAWAEHRRGHLRDAEEDYRRALGLYRRLLPPGHAYRAAAASGLGAVLLDLGRLAEARRYLREGLSQWEAHEPPEPDRLREVRELLARADPAAGRP